MGIRAEAWSADELAILEGIYADDSIENVLIVAATRLPGRTPNTIGNRASILGFSAARRARRGEKPRTGARGPRKPKTPHVVFPAPQPLPLLPGPCDRGDREIIRKRLVYTLGALSGELRRTSNAVAECVREIVKDNYREQFARLAVADLLDDSLRSYAPSTPRRMAS